MRAGDRWRRFGYVLLDGTDLGTGAVFLLFHDMSDRKQIISSILPIWDANETWIVLVAGGLIALFSAASVTLFSGLYLPVIAMLITLAGRGIALEFRDHGADENEKHRWDMVFLISSALTAFLQGLLFGAVLHVPPPASERHARCDGFSFRVLFRTERRADVVDIILPNFR